MAFEVFDFRKDIRNVLVTPEIRARFIQIDVGKISGGSRPGRGHSHDLGHEVFLVLQGQAEFDIDGDTHVVGPGQMCVALVDEVHTVRNVGDVPVILYLSVTPHIQPTHTFWTDDGDKAPPKFNPFKTYDVPPDKDTSLLALADKQAQAVDALQAAVTVACEVQREQLAVFKKEVMDGQSDAALQARDEMWSALYPMFQKVFALADVWNTLTYRTAEPEFQTERTT